MPPLSEAHKKKLADGRKKAAEKRRKEAIQRVRAFRAWNQADAAYYRAQRLGYPLPSKPKPPAVIPSDHDFRIARGEED